MPLPSIKTIKFKEDESYNAVLSRYYQMKESSEYSESSLGVTSTLIDANPSHYDFWVFRREVITALALRDLMDEYLWTLFQISSTLKNYQSWHHLHWLTTKKPLDVLSDRQFVEIGFQDAKNIHFWGFLVKYVRKTERCMEALSLTTRFIEQDVRNNSAWTFRYFVLKLASHHNDNDNTAEEERLFILKHAFLEHNTAFWNYVAAIPKILPLPAIEEECRARLKAAKAERRKGEAVQSEECTKEEKITTN